MLRLLSIQMRFVHAARLALFPANAYFLVMAPSFDDERKDGQDFLAGQLLIAMPNMGDPRFEKSVIFMCTHDEDHAMGVIVNKPLLSPSLLDALRAARGQGVDVGGPDLGMAAQGADPIVLVVEGNEQDVRLSVRRGALRGPGSRALRETRA